MSTIPAVPREQLQRDRERLLEARVDRLERELDALRRAAVVQTAAPPVVFVDSRPLVVAAPPAFWGPAWGPAWRPGWGPPHRVHPWPHPGWPGSGVSIRIGSGGSGVAIGGRAHPRSR